MAKGLILFVFSLLNWGSWAQLPQANFTIQSTACLFENVRFVDQSMDASKAEWDFCDNDLKSAPVFTDAGVIDQSTALVDLRLKNDSGNWYGFVCDGDANKLTRLFFGTSLANVP